MTEILKERDYIGNIVKYEAPLNYSRKVVTIASGSGVLKAGSVLELTADGYKPLSYTPAVTEGSAAPAKAGTPAAVLVHDIDATSAAGKAVAIVRHAIVVKEKLAFSFDDETVLQAVYDDLESIGIVTAKGE